MWLLAFGMCCTVVSLAAAGSADAAARGVDAHRPKPVARFVVPRGWSLVGRDAQAVVIDRSLGYLTVGDASALQYRYCLRSTGRFRVLVTDTNSADLPWEMDMYRHMVLSGVYVAYGTEDISGGTGDENCALWVTSYNLRTRQGSNVFDFDCTAYYFGVYGAGAPLGLLGPLSLNSRGFAAWRMTGGLPPYSSGGNDVTQQIYAYDSHGTRLLDSTPPGSDTALDNLKLKGDLLTWTHNGTPRQAQLG